MTLTVFEFESFEFESRFQWFQVTRVFNILKNIDPSKSGGPDEIPACILKALADILAVPS